MILETHIWESEKLLRTPEDVEAYLDAVLEEGDPALLEDAFAMISRSPAMAEIAHRNDVELDALKNMLHAARGQNFSRISEALAVLGFRFGLVARATSEDRDVAAAP